MRKLTLICTLLCAGLSAYGQTNKEQVFESAFNSQIRKFNKQQTIDWLREKLELLIVGDELTNGIKLFSIDECNIVFHYSDFFGREYEETLPTCIASLGKNANFKYSSKNCKILYKAFGTFQEKDKIMYSEGSFLSLDTNVEELLSNIEFAVKHLSTFCINR